MDRTRAEELYKEYQGGEHKDRAYVVSLNTALTATDNCEPMYKEFFGDFYDEAVTFINAMKTYIAEFRAGKFDQTSVYESFRLSHMVKGASATMGYKVISALSGGLEHMFSDARENKLALTPPLIDLVEHTMGLIAQHLEELKKNP
jgi:chemotaxis protein histidine kinase CheA